MKVHGLLKTLEMELEGLSDDLTSNVTLVGSAALALRGGRDVHDLDVVLSPVLFKAVQIAKKLDPTESYMSPDSLMLELADGDIQAFDKIAVGRYVRDWFSIPRTKESGWWVQSLSSFVAMKKQLKRDKDTLDLYEATRLLQSPTH